jgi:8-oxo-dGTP diphosphatase
MYDRTIYKRENLLGGHLEFGEEWEQCCHREVMEETGLKIRDVTFFACVNSFMKEDDKHYVTIFMQAWVADENQETKVMEPEKNEFWKWVQWDEIRTNADYCNNLFLPLDLLVYREDKPDPFSM